MSRNKHNLVKSLFEVIMPCQLEVAQALKLEESLTQREKPMLYFWEPKDFAIVLGRACKKEAEITAEAIRSSIPIYKRHTGGGTVLLSPGVLCWGLMLPPRPELCAPQKLVSEYLPVIAESFSALQQKIKVAGLGDLVAGEKKICGTAQRWRKTGTLLHGSLLVDFNLEKLSEYLSHPSREPDYRAKRKHQDFCTTLSRLCGKTIFCAEVSHIIAAAFWEKLKITEENLTAQ